MARISKSEFAKVIRISSMCFIKLLTFRFAVLKPFNLVILSKVESKKFEIPEAESHLIGSNVRSFSEMTLAVWTSPLSLTCSPVGTEMVSENPRHLSDCLTPMIFGLLGGTL